MEGIKERHLLSTSLGISSKVMDDSNIKKHHRTSHEFET